MSPEYEEVQKTFGREYTDKENEAAVTIQKYTRGYLTRKHLKGLSTLPKLEVFKKFDF